MTSSTATLPSPGNSAPLGASLSEGGANFSLYTRRATAVGLCLFECVEDAEPRHRFALDPGLHRTGDWHVRVEGIGPGQLYGWRVEGAWQPALGLRFDPANLLLDPHGLALAVPPGYGRAGDWGSAMKSVVADPLAYDWQGDRPLHRPSRETVIYELHVRGFTAHPSAGLPPEQAGTYRGLISKIPYLQDLGITAVELLQAQKGE
jgi:glycogen operon protein